MVGELSMQKTLKKSGSNMLESGFHKYENTKRNLIEKNDVQTLRSTLVNKTKPVANKYLAKKTVIK